MELTFPAAAVGGYQEQVEHKKKIQQLLHVTVMNLLKASVPF